MTLETKGIFSMRSAYQCRFKQETNEQHGLRVAQPDQILRGRDNLDFAIAKIFIRPKTIT
jgi:hypothetical protein